MDEEIIIEYWVHKYYTFSDELYEKDAIEVDDGMCDRCGKTYNDVCCIYCSRYRSDDESLWDLDICSTCRLRGNKCCNPCTEDYRACDSVGFVYKKVNKYYIENIMEEVHVFTNKFLGKLTCDQNYEGHIDIRRHVIKVYDSDAIMDAIMYKLGIAKNYPPRDSIFKYNSSYRLYEQKIFHTHQRFMILHNEPGMLPRYVSPEELILMVNQFNAADALKGKDKLVHMLVKTINDLRDEVKTLRADYEELKAKIN